MVKRGVDVMEVGEGVELELVEQHLVVEGQEEEPVKTKHYWTQVLLGVEFTLRVPVQVTPLLQSAQHLLLLHWEYLVLRLVLSVLDVDDTPTVTPLSYHLHKLVTLQCLVTQSYQVPLLCHVWDHHHSVLQQTYLLTFL